MRPCERWPGEGSALSLADAAERWARGNAGFALAIADGLHYADVNGAAEGDDELLLATTARSPSVIAPGAWPNLALIIRGSTRDLDWAGAGIYLSRISYLCREGWTYIHLVSGDPERLACVVLRDVIRRVGERPSMDQLELAVTTKLDYRYRVAPIENQPLAGAA